MSKETQYVVTLGIAIFGAGLSLFNTWKQWDRDRVKLKSKGSVQPWGAELDEPSPVFTIEVVNGRSFPITIAEAGVRFRKPGAPSISFSQTTERQGDTIDIPVPI